MSLVQNHHWYPFLFWPHEMNITTCMHLKKQVEVNTFTVRKAPSEIQTWAASYFYSYGPYFFQIIYWMLICYGIFLPSIFAHALVAQYQRGKEGFRVPHSQWPSCVIWAIEHLQPNSMCFNTVSPLAYYALLLLIIVALHAALLNNHHHLIYFIHVVYILEISQ